MTHSIPADVEEKLLRFGRAAVAAASMRGKFYLQIGSVTMGIGGSIIDSDFIESYLGMRVESVDEVEIIRRIDRRYLRSRRDSKKLSNGRKKHVRLVGTRILKNCSSHQKRKKSSLNL